MNRRALPPPAGDRREGLRGALLHTLPGRAIVVGVGIKLVVLFIGLALGGVPQFFGVVDTVAGLAAACGLAYFLFRLIVVAKRRLLWRVRRKLILSYVFIGFVPALLLVAFSLLCGFLLFYSFSSYLVQSRLRALSEQARFLAQSAALEIQRAGGRDAAGILALRQANAAREYPEASMAVVPVSRACGGSGTSSPASPVSVVRLQTSGPWSHVDPPDAIPSWIGCDGFTGVLAYSHRRTVDGPAEDTHLHGAERGVSRRAASELRGRRRSPGERRDPPAAAQGHGRRAEERDGRSSAEGRRCEAVGRTRRRRRTPRRSAGRRPVCSAA